MATILIVDDSSLMRLKPITMEKISETISCFLDQPLPAGGEAAPTLHQALKHRESDMAQVIL